MFPQSAPALRLTAAWTTLYHKGSLSSLTRLTEPLEDKDRFSFTSVCSASEVVLYVYLIKIS